MEQFRKILFYILASVYVVVCPLLILYAFGYILAPSTEQGYATTGLIYINTAPRGCSVYNNGELFAQKTPVELRDLLPGEYVINVRLSGYRPWRRTIKVRAEKASVFAHVLMTPDKWESRRILEGEYSELFPLGDTGSFLALERGESGGLVLCSSEEEDARHIVPRDGAISENDVRDVHVVPGSDQFLVDLSSSKNPDMVLVKGTGSSLRHEDIGALFPVPPLSIKWEAGSEDEMFSFQAGYINLIKPSEYSVHPKYIRHVRGFAVGSGQIIVMYEDGTIYRMGYDKKGKTAVLDNRELAEHIFGKKGYYRIEEAGDNDLLFLGEDGRLLMNRLPYHLVEKGVEGVKPLEGGEKVLLWTKDSIGVLDLSMEQTGNVPFEEGPELKWVFRGGEHISQCFWVYEGSHVLFRDGRTLFLVEIGPGGIFPAEEIFSVKRDSSVVYIEQEGTLYYLDGHKGVIRKVEILPGENNKGLELPEQAVTTKG